MVMTLRMSTAAIEWYKGCADKTEWQMSHGGFHIGSTAFYSLWDDRSNVKRHKLNLMWHIYKIPISHKIYSSTHFTLHYIAFLYIYKYIYKYRNINKMSHLVSECWQKTTSREILLCFFECEECEEWRAIGTFQFDSPRNKIKGNMLLRLGLTMRFLN